MEFLHVVGECFAPFCSIMITMGLAYLAEKYGTGKNLTVSKPITYLIVVLSIVLTFFYLFKTPLGSPLFEVLGSDSSAGTLVLFSGNIGMPIPLALLAAMVFFLFCGVVAVCTSVSIILIGDIIVGRFLKLTKR